MSQRRTLRLRLKKSATETETEEAEAEDAEETETEAESLVETASDAEVDGEAETEAETETATETESEGVADADTQSRLVLDSLQQLEYQSATAAGIVAGSRRKTLKTEQTRWASCLANSNPLTGVTTLSAVAFKSAPPLRDQSFVVNIDGTYKGPEVTYGSATLQLARTEKAGPVLVYRHSIVLSDVFPATEPLVSGPLSATMYIPQSAFNLMAKEGPYVLTVTFTNQYKEPFGCAQLNFKLD